MSDEQLFQRYGKTFAVGKVLCREGEPGSEMYVIQAGKVRISVQVRGLEKTLAVLGTGEFFGEMSLLNKKPRSATATVLEEARLLVLDPRTFEAMLRGSGDIALRMIRKLAARLQEADDQLANLLLVDPISRVVDALLRLCLRDRPQEGGVRIELTIEELAGRVGLPLKVVETLVNRLAANQILSVAETALTVSNVSRLQEVLHFLEMKEKFGNI